MSKTICDKCDRRKQCNEENRLTTFTTLDDYFFDSAYTKDGKRYAHGMLRIGEVCPLKQEGNT